MALQITIAQSGKPVTVAGQAREDLDLGTAVTLTASGASGSLTWSLHDAPLSDDLSATSTAALSSTSANPTSIIPDNSGTYFIRCTSGTETVGITFYAGVPLATNPSDTPRRVPALDEELEHTAHDAPEPSGNTRGWKRELDRWFAVITKNDKIPSGIWSQFGNLGSDEVTPAEIIPGPGTTFEWDGTNLKIVSMASMMPLLGAVQYPGLGTRQVAKAEGPTLPANGSYTLVDIDGAGFMSQISMTFASAGAAALEDSRMQIFVDGESVASVDVPFKDLCCCRGAAGAFNNANIFSEMFSATIHSGGNGTSFRRNLVAPFSTHLKVVIVNGDASNTALLGGFVEYYLGTHYNWGLFGKLHAISLPNAGTAVAPYADIDLMTITSTTGGVFVGSYLHWVPGSGDGNNFQEGDFSIFVDGTSLTMQYDSTEDYYSNGFYFQGGTFNTSEIGANYFSSSTLGAWRTHFRDPMQFASSFKFRWSNGFNSGSHPVTNNTTIRGVLWYYTGAVGSVSTPTTSKGDQGVPGADGRNQLSAVDHAAAGDTVTLWQGNGTLADTATLNYTLSTGTARYMQLIPGCPTMGFYFDGLTYLLRDLRSSFLDLTGDMTLQFLLRIFSTHATTGATIISYAAPGDTGGDDNALWQVSISPAASGLNPVLGWFSEHGAGVNDSTASTFMLPLNELMHISIRRSGTNLTFFINGNPADTFSGITLPTVSGSPLQKLRLGADAGATVESSTKYLLASVRVGNTAKSDATILADAKSCLGWV